MLIQDFDFYLFANDHGEVVICYSGSDGNKVITDVEKIPYTGESLLEDIIDGFSMFSEYGKEIKKEVNIAANVLGIRGSASYDRILDGMFQSNKYRQLTEIWVRDDFCMCEFYLGNARLSDYRLLVELKDAFQAFCKNNHLEWNGVWGDMIIHDFINSKDIGQYWMEIGYEPTALEYAWLVWQSKNHTLMEKHAGWRDIIDNYEDCTIPAGLHDIPQESLHRFLERYMELELGLVSKFYENEPNAVYSYRFHCDGDENWCEESALFSTFEEMRETAMKDRDLSPNFYEYVKTYIGAEDKRIYLRETIDGQIVRVDENRYLTDEKDYEIFREIWDGMYFVFPTPFKKGDIVETVRGKYTRHSHFGGTFALTSVCTEYREFGDGSDMTAHGYFVGMMGEVYHECVHNYMDLEYVQRELQNEERLLIPISNYLKGNIDLALLLGAQRTILCEEEAKDTKRLLNYTKEGFKLGGIEK